MNLPVVFRRRAQDDLTAAHDWYEEQKPALGAEFMSAVLSTFESN